MLLDYKNGQTSVVFRVKVRNSSVSTGAGLTGLTSASSGLIISTIADNESSATAYTAAGSTIDTIATLGTFATPTAAHCRFKQVDSTNHPGVYEVQIDNARFAVSNAKSLLVSITGATNAADCDVVIPLRSVDPYSAASFMTGVNGVAPPTNWNLEAIDASGRVDVGKILGTASAGAAGSVAIDFAQSLPTTPAANSVGEALFLDDIRGGRINTAQAGSSTTITLDAGASSTAGAYVGDGVYLYGGTGGGIRGTGQQRTVVAYNTSTKVATVDRAWTTNPDATSKFVILPTPKSDLYLWQGTSPNVLQSGRVDAYAGVVNDKTGYALTAGEHTAIITDVWTTAGTRVLTAGTNIVLAKGTGVTGFNDILATAIVSGGAITTSGGAVSTVTTLTNLPAIPANWLTGTGVDSTAVTKIQAGLSTYAGGDTAGTTTLLARLTSTRAGLLDNLTNLDAAVSTRSTYAGADTAGTGTLLTRIPGTVQPQTGDSYARIGLAGAALTGITGAALGASGLDAIVAETGVNARQALALILDALLAKFSGAGSGTSTVAVRDVNDTVDRATVVVDGNGNRTSSTLHPPV